MMYDIGIHLLDVDCELCVIQTLGFTAGAEYLSIRGDRYVLIDDLRIIPSGIGHCLIDVRSDISMELL